ncbi:hypothetical protein QBC35DRAFT_531720 [Podospora australis]|uniref:Uncharacterized protein n=1 Tax=Podospora australis TaxID=1536484 RepID=A0AAN6WVU1_9PEZI|nr:hypothetical protein QBC35DRAFT_531720 [Podospora australis]
MRSSTLPLLGAALLPSLVSGITIPFLDVCKVSEVLEYFSCLRPVPEGCVENVKEQADAFCSSYLSVEPVTTYLSTATPEPPVSTVTEFATVSLTSVEYVWTIIPTTITTTEVSTALETVITTATASSLAPVKRHDDHTPVPSVTPVPHCPDLSKKLAHKPAWKLSKACSCLDPEPTTITISATTAPTGEPTTATEAATTTVVVIETSTSTERPTVVVTESTVLTEIATATTTTTLPAPEPTCNQPGGACNINNFVTACCAAPDGSVGCYFPGGDPMDGICFN